MVEKEKADLLQSACMSKKCQNQMLLKQSKASFFTLSSPFGFGGLGHYARVIPTNKSVGTILIAKAHEIIPGIGRPTSPRTVAGKAAFNRTHKPDFTLIREVLSSQRAGAIRQRGCAEVTTRILLKSGHKWRTNAVRGLTDLGLHSQIR